MKYCSVLVGAALLGLAALPAEATSEPVRGSYVHKALVDICTDAKQDDRLGLHRTLKAYNISRQDAVDKVMCNQRQLVNFARFHQAHRVVRMLERYERAPERKVTITDISPSAN